MSTLAIGNTYRIRKASGYRDTLVTLIAEDPTIDPTYRYVLRIDACENHGDGRGHHKPGDTFTVESQWFDVRGAIWPREGGVQRS
jgi:hypothetical protein